MGSILKWTKAILRRDKRMKCYVSNDNAFHEEIFFKVILIKAVIRKQSKILFFYFLISMNNLVLYYYSGIILVSPISYFGYSEKYFYFLAQGSS